MLYQATPPRAPSYSIILSLPFLTTAKVVFYYIVLKGDGCPCVWIGVTQLQPREARVAAVRLAHFRHVLRPRYPKAGPSPKPRPGYPKPAQAQVSRKRLPGR